MDPQEATSRVQSLPATSEYLLGHSDAEMRRLTLQAELLAPITRRFLLEAGLAPGMRVLDFGCGLGDVTGLVSELVGPEGQIVGVDLSPTAVNVASRRFATPVRPHVRFVAGDVSRQVFDCPFDAVVGRYVLMYQRDPGATLRALAKLLRAGGLMVFHELDWGGARSWPPVPFYDGCCRSIVEGLERGSAEAYMGTKLGLAFEQAGLTTPVMRLEAIIGSVSDPMNSVRNMLASMIPPALGDLFEDVGSSAEDLGGRLIRDVEASGSIVVGRSEVGAWTRTSVR